MAERAELHLKYRPKYFKEVIGQDPVIKSLAKIVERDDVHAFLLGGPSGCGKTTLARIVAAEVGCDLRSVMEIDAATTSGVDAMRSIQEPLMYRPFSGADARAVIIDECHALSKAAWQALLKGVEEPNRFVYWFFCTTELGKVPQTIKTRCASYTLKSVSDEALSKHCDMVCKAEQIKLATGVHDVLIRSSNGSPRQMLVNLAQVRDCANRKEAADMLRAVLDSDGTLELARFLMKGGSWMQAMTIFEKIADENPEGVRIIVCNYMASVLKGSTTDKQATRALTILENFAAEYNASEKAAPLLLSIGRSLFAS
jgi:DNA polymerase III gamma/tau subunit